MLEFLQELFVPILTLIISTFVSYFVAKKTSESSNDLVIYQILTDARKEVENAVYKYAETKKEIDKLFIELKRESFLNALELLCKYYIENKIDRKTFRDIYKYDLTIVKELKYSKFFEHLSQYQNTIILYKHLHQNFPLPKRIL